jgi:LysR family glycine cleavage system transcriptional activator
MSDPLATVPLSAVRVFEAAARLLSFTRAAEELGMTQAAVSWQVKALERRLDQPLFRRLPREVALTPAGERLARAASEAVAALRSAISDISQDGDGVLVISTLQTFATQWLASRLGGFQVAHPQIAVRLDVDNRIVDLLREDVDVAIRAGRGDWPEMEAHFLFPLSQTVLVAAAAMPALGDPPRPEALLQMARIGHDDEWSPWFANAGLLDSDAPPPAAPRLSAGTQTVEVAAALATGGVAIGSPIMFGREIAEGRLFQPFEVYIGSGRSSAYWLVYPKDRRRARKIVAFRDWLIAQVQADPFAEKLRASQPAA